MRMRHSMLRMSNDFRSTVCGTSFTDSTAKRGNVRRVKVLEVTANLRSAQNHRRQALSHHRVAHRNQFAHELFGELGSITKAAAPSARRMLSAIWASTRGLRLITDQLLVTAARAVTDAVAQA